MDVLKSLSMMRQDRGGLVPTLNHFFFIHKALNWATSTRKPTCFASSNALRAILYWSGAAPSASPTLVSPVSPRKHSTSQLRPSLPSSEPCTSSTTMNSIVTHSCNVYAARESIDTQTITVPHGARVHDMLRPRESEQSNARVSDVSDASNAVEIAELDTEPIRRTSSEPAASAYETQLSVPTLVVVNEARDDDSEVDDV